MILNQLTASGVFLPRSSRIAHLSTLFDIWTGSETYERARKHCELTHSQLLPRPHASTTHLHPVVCPVTALNKRIEPIPSHVKGSTCLGKARGREEGAERTQGLASRTGDNRGAFPPDNLTPPRSTPLLSFRLGVLPHFWVHLFYSYNNQGLRVLALDLWQSGGHPQASCAQKWPHKAAESLAVALTLTLRSL